MKLLFIIGLTVFLPLAVIVGVRLEPETLALIVGATCAGIPLMSLVCLCLVLLFRNRNQTNSSPPAQQYPPIVVVQGGDPQRLPMPPMQASLPTPGNSRDFDVIGSDADVYDWEDDV